jgi:hypothetical protein
LPLYKCLTKALIVIQLQFALFTRLREPVEKSIGVPFSRTRLSRYAGTLSGRVKIMESPGRLRSAALVTVLLTGGCSTAVSTACRCPNPVAYDDATIKKITRALKDLPPDSVLHRAMDDYEDERDDLRACLAPVH